MINVADAVKIIYSSLPKLEPEIVALGKACGRVLAGEIRARRDSPPFPRVAMDGVAIQLSSYQNGRRNFKIAGIQAAGHPHMQLEDGKLCLEVMTGATLPLGADAVIPYEDIQIEDGLAILPSQLNLKLNMNVHCQAADYAEGEVLLKGPVTIGANNLAVIATEGGGQISVLQRPSIAIVSTGDELVEPGVNPLAHQIIRSNPYVMAAALKTYGREPQLIAHLNDTREELYDGLEKILSQHQVLILSGGVSKGKFDFVPEVLGQLGVKKMFHRVLQKPGKPLFFGIGAKGQLVFGLPGNPVSSLVNFRRYVIPALQKMEGIESKIIHAELAETLTYKKEMTYFIPIKLTWREKAAPLATPLSGQGSGDFYTLSNSCGFLEINTAHEGLVVNAGNTFKVYLWENV